MPPTDVILFNALITVAVMIGVLHILASRLAHACDLYDLKQNCDRLRKEYAARLAALREELDGEILEVDVVGRVAPEEAERLAA